MHHMHKAELERLGLSAPEAQVYLALLENGPLGASGIATTTRMPRTSVYPTLSSLADKGMVEGGAGYGSRFSAISPEHALPALVEREKHELIEREQLAGQLADRLAPLAEPGDDMAEAPIQVLRTLQVISDRHDRLQLEADRTIDIITKPPIINLRADNPAQRKAQSRGVLVRGLYERSTIDDPAIKPFLNDWIKSGEEARVYDGELPHKLVIYDAHTVLLILALPGAQTRSVLIRHEALARSLGIMFEFFWNQAEPIALHVAHNGATAEPTRVNGARPKKTNIRRATNHGRKVASQRD